MNRRESQLPGDKGIQLSSATDLSSGKYIAFRLTNSFPVSKLLYPAKIRPALNWFKLADIVSQKP